MQIVLDELAPGRWEVAIIPTTKAEELAGAPSEGKVALVLMGVAEDLFTKLVDSSEVKKEKAGKLIQIPQNPDQVLRTPRMDGP